MPSSRAVACLVPEVTGLVELNLGQTGKCLSVAWSFDVGYSFQGFEQKRDVRTA